MIPCSTTGRRVVHDVVRVTVCRTHDICKSKPPTGRAATIQKLIQRCIHRPHQLLTLVICVQLDEQESHW